MKDLHVTIRIRNNQIYKRRKALGLTQAQVAAVSEMSLPEFQKLENCTGSPLDRMGNWSKQAISLSNFFCEEPELIFSEDVLSVKKSKITAEINKNTLLAQTQCKLLETGMDNIEKMELSEATRKALSSLTVREEKVLRMRFGIGENSDHTLEETSKDFNICSDRIRQIEAKALRKLRHPSRANKLEDFKG